MTDVRVASLLFNHARKRAVERAFGVRPTDANLVTVVALLLVADLAHDRIGRLRRIAWAPGLDDGALAGASLRSVLGAIVGPAVDQTPALGALIALALLGHGLRPTVTRSVSAVRTSSQRAALDFHRGALDFHHRYGYLVDPGHLRQRRAQRREARAPS